MNIIKRQHERKHLLILILILITGYLQYSRQTIVLDATPSPNDVVEEDDFASLKQVLVGKKSKTVSLETESKFACQEADCVSACADEIKCETDTCKKIKMEKCKKTCAKQRCSARCKIEPMTSYVQREMIYEKCTDSCSKLDSSKLAKCKTKCDEEKKSCKEKCRERAIKFPCVRPLLDLDEENKNNAPIFENTDLI